MFEQEPYKTHMNKFNIYGILKPSVESGVDEPRANIFRETTLNATFNSMGSERYLLTEDNKTMRDLAGYVPYDAIYIMVNNHRYGGGGIYNLFCTFTADAQFSKYLFIHEFGHSFVNRTVLQHNAQLEKTKELFLPVKEAMIPQGYQDWQTCMIEHFVRAGEIIVLDQLGDHTQSEELLNNYRDNRKFIYLDFTVDKLKEYRLEKKLYYQESVRATLSDLYKYHIGG
jgi:hypothetical protein